VRRGRHEYGHAGECGPARNDGRNHADHLAPALRGDADMGEAERSVIASDGGGNREQQRNAGACQGHAHEREGPLAEREGRPSDQEGDQHRADKARAVMIGSDGGGKAQKAGQGINREGKQQPAQKADREDTENKAKNKHGGALRPKVTGPRLHHPPWRTGILAHQPRNEHCNLRNGSLPKAGKTLPIFGKEFPAPACYDEWAPPRPRSTGAAIAVRGR
jgi:hypothetical protein